MVNLENWAWTEGKLGNIAKTAQQFYLHGEKRVKIKRKREKDQNGEKREKKEVEEKAKKGE